MSISPGSNYIPPQPSGGGGSSVKTAVLFGAILALLAANVYLFVQLDHVRTDVAGLRDGLQKEIARVQETTSLSTQTHRRNLSTLRDELEAARRQASMAAGQARAEATKHAEELAKRLEVEQRRAAEVQKQTQAEITQVKEVANTATTKITEVSTEVGNVKTEVASTRSELDKTISNLKAVTGDLGLQSGLIATNSKEISALRQLGERNYFEFSLAKQKQPQRIGDIGVVLKKADTKRNRYTIELIADDRKVEKKDKTVNEPVQFLVQKARQPYELVVNEVKKDQIVGYLSTPKVQQTRN